MKIKILSVLLVLYIGFNLFAGFSALANIQKSVNAHQYKMID